MAGDRTMGSNQKRITETARRVFVALCAKHTLDELDNGVLQQRLAALAYKLGEVLESEHSTKRKLPPHEPDVRIAGRIEVKQLP